MQPAAEALTGPPPAPAAAATREDVAVWSSSQSERLPTSTILLFSAPALGQGTISDGVIAFL